MSASSLKGLIYSILPSVTPSVSILFLPTVSGLSGELRRCLFHGRGMRGLRSQTDVSSARQFQPGCHANKNGQCIFYLFSLMTRWSRVHTKPQYCEVDLYNMRLYCEISNAFVPQYLQNKEYKSINFVIGNVLMKGVRVKFGQNSHADPKHDLQEESKVKHPLMHPRPGSQI